jgi:hypothetical protein
MSPEELAAKLKEMYFDSKDGEAAVSIHLFGIKYADQIKESGASPAGIAKLAGVPDSYATEISKGCKLARYVVLK